MIPKMITASPAIIRILIKDLELIYKKVYLEFQQALLELEMFNESEELGSIYQSFKNR